MITDEQKSEMKRLRFDEYYTLEEIAVIYGVSRQRVHQILGESQRVRTKRAVKQQLAREESIS